MLRSITSLGSLIRTVPRLTKFATPVINKTLIRTFADAVRFPRVQGFAPDFKGTAVVCDDFKEIALCDFRGKYLVLVFYPLDFTFVCPTELIAFNDRYEDFQKIDTEIVGVSVDSHYTHLGWMNTSRNEGGLGPLKYPLLSDITKQIAKDYEVLLHKEGIALRALFIIDPTGMIKHMSVNDLTVGRSVDETIRLLQAFKFVDEKGEGCPANWNKGDKSIKTDPKGSKEYFKCPKQ